jgi:hypothetical protein
VEVQRAIALVLRRTKGMYDDEKTPLLTHIKRATSDRITHAILADEIMDQ